MSRHDYENDSLNLSWGGSSERDLNEIHAAHRDMTPRFRAAYERTCGAVEAMFVCSAEEHEAIKASPKWDDLPTPRGGRYSLNERLGDEPAELLEYKNCSCRSTIAKVIDTDESPTWLETLRLAGLL